MSSPQPQNQNEPYLTTFHANRRYITTTIALAEHFAKNLRGWVPLLNYTAKSGPVLILQKRTFLRSSKGRVRSSNYVVLADKLHNTIIAEIPANAHNDKIFSDLKGGSYYDMNVGGCCLQPASEGWDETGLGRTIVISSPNASTFKLRADLGSACTTPDTSGLAPLDNLDWYPIENTVVTIAKLVDAKDTMRASIVTGFVTHHQASKVDTEPGAIPKTRHDYTLIGSDGAIAVIRHLHQDGTQPILTEDDIFSVITITGVIFNRTRGKFYLGKNALAFRAMESPEHNAIAELDPITIRRYIAAAHPNARTIAIADDNENNGVTLSTLHHPVNSPVTLRLVLAHISGADYTYETYQHSKRKIKGTPNPKLGQVIRRPKLSVCLKDVGAYTNNNGMWTTLWTDKHICDLTNHTVADCTKADIEGDVGSQGMDLLRTAIGTTVIVTFTTILDRYNKTKPAGEQAFKLVVEEIAPNTATAAKQ